MFCTHIGNDKSDGTRIHILLYQGIPHQHSKINVGFLLIILYICNFLNTQFRIYVLFNGIIFRHPINIIRFLHCKENWRSQRCYIIIVKLKRLFQLTKEINITHMAFIIHWWKPVLIKVSFLVTRLNKSSDWMNGSILFHHWLNLILCLIWMLNSVK